MLKPWQVWLDLAHNTVTFWIYRILLKHDFQVLPDIDMYLFKGRTIKAAWISEKGKMLPILLYFFSFYEYLLNYMYFSQKCTGKFFQWHNGVVFKFSSVYNKSCFFTSFKFNDIRPLSKYFSIFRVTCFSCIYLTIWLFLLVFFLKYPLVKILLSINVQ